MRVLILIILLFCLTLYSCKKATNSELTTIISGQFYDTSNQEPGHITVKVCKEDFVSTSGFLSINQSKVVTVLDSTTTDANGNYRLSFKSNSSEVINAYMYFYYGPQQLMIRDRGSSTYFSIHYYNSKPITSFGSTLTFNFDILKTYYMKAHVTFQNNPYQPIFIYYSPGPYGSTIYGKNNDTVVYVPIRKNVGAFYLQFYNVNLTPIANTVYYSPKFSLNPLINRDTIDGGNYPLTPSIFTKTP
jgi:hypothetical protein